ncbi:MAG: DUF116 domain-containing protein [Methanomicrobiales archaeon]|jgi:hypothetical protein|nr:DUF116 domain-containing protein [Methanomicrobiales archaeon]
MELIPLFTSDPLLQQIILFLGELALLFLIIVAFIGFILFFLFVYAIKTDFFLFPEFLKAGVMFLEGFMRSLFKIFGVPDYEVLQVMVRLHNTLNKKRFTETSVARRAIFIPHCLRAIACPAHLHPEEGLKCRSCGLCSIGYAKKMLQQVGYMVFIVPGSSFIKRLVQEHRPKAIVGIGCLLEVKEGNVMAERYGLVSMGVVSTKDGCVETEVDWDKVFEIALLGIDPQSVPKELRKFLPQ